MPQGDIRISRPQISWNVWADAPESIVRAEVAVDGQPIPARYDAETRSVVARSESTLAPGEHAVAATLHMDRGYRVNRRWRFTVLPGSIEELPEPNAKQAEALAAVNSFRLRVGLPALRPHPALNAAALAHTLYNERNRTTGHYQARGRQGYFGEEPGERLAAYGFFGDSWEAVSLGRTSAPEAIEALVAGPYHRLPFLQPGSLGLGAGFVGERLTLSFELGGEKATVVYPFDGQTDVPVAWNGLERPNPLRIHPGAAATVGYPVTFAHFDGAQNCLEVLGAELRTEAGEPVACYLNTPSNDDWLRNAAILIPIRPLLPATGYLATVRVRLDGSSECARTWRFQTASSSAGRRSDNRPRLP